MPGKNWTTRWIVKMSESEWLNASMTDADLWKYYVEKDFRISGQIMSWKCENLMSVYFYA